MVDLIFMSCSLVLMAAVAAVLYLRSRRQLTFRVAGRSVDVERLLLGRAAEKPFRVFSALNVLCAVSLALGIWSFFYEHAETGQWQYIRLAPIFTIISVALYYREQIPFLRRRSKSV